MSNRQVQLLTCPVCDTVIEILAPCGLEVVCCGRAMIQLADKAHGLKDAHALSVERCPQGIRVAVTAGGGAHPSRKDHRVAWIEIRTGDLCYRQFLNVGDAPEAVFNVDAERVVARAYCSAHGMWRTEKEFSAGKGSRRAERPAA